jgi:hypothetical protein|tara:strand:- start:3371 stop:5206 length:1836 start_codon:yes stop_codon:yes gene_type:complete
MATNIESTQLDFTTIKNSLKTYLAAKTEFADYDFEASGISNILDVLAYNTHYNALIANFALNESYLNTAQLRSSVVSHAISLGYEPRSISASRATINISLNLAGVSNRSNTYTLPALTSFTSSVNDVTYTFRSLEAITATDDGAGLYRFLNANGQTSIIVYEGTLKTKTFYVGETGERQLYIIPDNTIDTSTATVKVFANSSTDDFTSYTPLAKAVRVSSISQFYQITETPNGFYELNFGDGVSFGKSPSTGNIIQIEYLSTVGLEANGAKVFTPSAQLVINSESYSLTVVTSAQSSSGAVKQSIESIRQNAPIAFASQQRLVTAEDYKAIILKNYANVTDAIAWGGEDNVPTNYGNVYVGLKFASGTTDDEKVSTKDSIISNLTDNLSVLSIGTIFVDPIDTFIESIVEFSFDPNLTSVTLQSTEAAVGAVVRQFFADNLGVFGKTFRKSALLTKVDAVSSAIISSSVGIKVQQRFEPTLNTSLQYEINFPVALAPADDINRIVTSSTFTFNGKIALIKNALSSTKLQITDTLNNVLVDNVGQYTPKTGKIELVGFNPTAITSGNTFIKLSSTPVNENVIKPLRNFVISLDNDASFASGLVDRQTVNVAL